MPRTARPTHRPDDGERHSAPTSRPHPLLARLRGPAEPEVSCEECFERLDEYVEVELAGGDPERAVPGMAAHLDGCPACREDHEALRELVRNAPS